MKFQLKKKCFNFHRMFFTFLHLLMLMVLLKPTYCRLKHPDHIKYNWNNDTAFKINQIKLINDSAEMDHPTVTYKDDFVDENYVEKAPKLSTDQYRLLPPEKIYFDIIPLESIEQEEDFNEHEKLHMHLVHLNEDINLDIQNSKEGRKWAQKNLSSDILHNRSRRSLQEIADKINPFLRNSIYPLSFADNQNHHKPLLFGNKVYTKVPVAGKKHNALDIPIMPVTTDAPISFEGRVAADENDRVVFSSGPRTTSRPVPTRRPPEPLFRNPNPENFDFSFMNPGSQSSNAVSQNNRQPNRLGVISASAAVRESPIPTSPSMIVTTSSLTKNPRPTAAPRRISQCVWAIVNCCSTTSNEIRYNCFERNGCYGAFWGLNPCADNVRENIITYVAG